MHLTGWAGMEGRSLDSQTTWIIGFETKQGASPVPGIKPGLMNGGQVLPPEPHF